MRSPVPLDRKNSWIGKEIFRFRRELVAQMGVPELTATQVATLELCCQVKARLLTLDKEFADSGGDAATQTYQTTRSYIQLVTTLNTQLRNLGLAADTILLKQRQAQAGNNGPPGLQERLQLLHGGKDKASG